MTPDDPPPDLQACATALCAELAALEKAVRETDRLPIDSDKALQRARKLLETCGAHQARLAGQLHGLAAAIQTSQARIQACMDETVALSQRIAERAERRNALVERVAGLGRAAGEIQGPVQAATARGADGGGHDEILAVVNEVVARTGALFDEATVITSDARADGWNDVARQADALRQQIQSVRSKLIALQRAVAERAPS